MKLEDMTAGELCALETPEADKLLWKVWRLDRSQGYITVDEVKGKRLTARKVSLINALRKSK